MTLRPAVLVAVAFAVACSAPNAPPSAPVVMIAPSSPLTKDSLKASIVGPSIDPEGQAVTYAYQWVKDGTPQADLLTDTAPAERTKKGEVWTVLVTPSDGRASGPVGSASVTIGNTPPVVTVGFAPEVPTAATGLSAVPTATDADGDTVSYAWSWTRKSQSTAFVDAAIPASELKRGDTWKVTVTPNDGAAGESASATVTVANALPEVASLTLNPTEPTKANTLLVVAGAVTDADKDATSVKYAWTVNGTEVAGHTGSALAAQHFKKGDTVVASVRANDGTADGPALTATTTILNAAASVAGVSISPANAGKGDTFTCTPSGWADLDGDAEGYAYEWKVGSTPVGTAATLAGAGLTKGQSLTCTVTPTDGTSSGTPRTSSAVTVANTPPTLAAVVLSPANPTKADTLTASPAGFADIDGDAENYAYMWKRNGSVISGQTGATLGGASFSKGQVITVEVRPFDGTSAGTAVVSNAVTVVNSPPQLASVTVAPSGGGTPVRGKALVATGAGVADADGDMVTVRHEWRVNGLVVQGNSGNTLPGTSFSRGDTVSVVVTPDDGALSGTPVASSNITIQNAPPTAPSVSITPASPNDADDLVCSVTTPSSDADGDGLSYSFAWTRTSPGGTSQPFGGAAATGPTSSTVAGSDTSPGDIFGCISLSNDAQESGPSSVASIVTVAGLNASFACLDDDDCAALAQLAPALAGRRCDNNPSLEGSLAVGGVPSYQCVPASPCNTTGDCFFPPPGVTDFSRWYCVAGGECRCAPEPAPNSGTTGVCRRVKPACAICSSNAECGSDPALQSRGECRALQGDSSGQTYCLKFHTGPTCGTGYVADGSGFCVPQSGSCAGKGCVSDGDCAAGTVCNASTSLCEQRCYWNFDPNVMASVPTCGPAKSCWVDAASLASDSPHFGSGRCRPPCGNDSDCSYGGSFPDGRLKLKCAEEQTPSGPSLKRCRPNGACMDSRECPATAADSLENGYCDRSTFTCEAGCRLGVDPLTGAAFDDCKPGHKCLDQNGTRACQRLNCAELGGARIACPASHLCHNEDRNGDGVIDPAPAGAAMDAIGCYRAPSPPYCFPCELDSECQLPVFASYSPLPNLCIQTGPNAAGEPQSICGVATFNDPRTDDGGIPREQRLCPANWYATAIPVDLVTGQNHCNTNADCSLGNSGGLCDFDTTLKITDAQGNVRTCSNDSDCSATGEFRCNNPAAMLNGGNCVGKSCMCNAPNGTECPNDPNAGITSVCRYKASGLSRCVTSVVCLPSATYIARPVDQGGCGL